MSPISLSPNRVAVGLLRGYKRFISPFLPPSCRFYPTCSEYAAEAFASRPFFEAIWLTIRRLARCGPWCDGGYDPLPELNSETERH